MAAASTDKLRKWSRKWVGQIGAAGVSDASVVTIPLASSTNLPTTTGITLVIDRVDSSGALTPTLEETVVGVVSGTNIVTAVRGVEGTAQAHAAGAVVELLITATEHNDLIDHLLVEHNQDGTHLSSVVTTLTGTQTLTNKTLTSPKIGTNIKDTNGNELVTLTATGSAVNEVTLANGATGTGPTFTASGDDTNIDLNLKGKGTGEAKIYNYDDSTYYSAGEFLNNSLYRQAIINGNFDVWQRGTSFALDGSESYACADRWCHIVGGGSAGSGITRQSFTLGQTTVPNNPKYYLEMVVTSLTGTQYIRQKIEGVDKFAGTSVTLSFWAKIASGTISLIPKVVQNFGTGGSPSGAVTTTGSTKTITTTWTKFTETFAVPSITGKTLGTAGDWVGISLEPQAAATLDIAQVQLCAGSVALPFMPKSFEDELRACRRYYYRPSWDNTDTYAALAWGQALSATQALVVVQLPVHMRTVPTLENSSVTLLALSKADSNNQEVTVIGAAGSRGSTDLFTISVTVATNLTAGNATLLTRDADASGYIALTAEL